MKNLLATSIICLGIIFSSCTEEADTTQTEVIATKITMNGIMIPEGFEIEKIYEPGKHNQGSWVSITKDDRGRLYTSDQYGNIYRLTLPDTVNQLDSTNVEVVDVHLGQAQGLLWHKNVLYACVNANENRDMKIHSGLYKITDSDENGDFDTSLLMRSFDGEGEHGPHNIILSPDRQSLLVVLGNHTDVPDDIESKVPKVWGEDNLLPVIKDPSGHANDRMAPGGWIVQTDFDGKEWNLISVGMRNTYDIALNQDGELFGFDSDMEYDMGMPWYRPIRLSHITSGSDFGWRTGTGKFHAMYPDNLPGIGNMGQGSPTGLLEGFGLKFPTYYQNGFYLFDWSYGTMYFASLTPEGSSYTAEITEFLSGVPLPLTNGIAGDDGAMYFLTGGRRLESGLYRLKYTGSLNSEIQEFAPSKRGAKDRKLRIDLEALHKQKDASKLSFIIKYLDHPDRYIRFAARIAMEHQDFKLWKDEIKSNNRPLKTIALSIAIARHGNDSDRLSALNQLLKIDWVKLDEERKIDVLRSIDLLIIRSKDEIDEDLKNDIISYVYPHYLKESNLLNKEICALLSYLQVGDIIAPTVERMIADTSTTNLKSIYLSGDVTQRSEQYGKDVERMLANMPNEQNISYAKSLSVIKSGWTTETRESYFRWYNRALEKSGGLMYTQFIKSIQESAIANLPLEEQEYFEALASESMVQNSKELETIVQPVGPGQVWTIQDIVNAYDQNKDNADKIKGQDYFKATLCSTCHSVNGEGGNSGPELSQVETRFSATDLAISIVEPSSTISDRYMMTEYQLDDGRIVTGRVVKEEGNRMEISTNAFAPELTTIIQKHKIVKMLPSPHSSMPPGLVNRLNPREMADLMAYLLDN